MVAWFSWLGGAGGAAAGEVVSKTLESTGGFFKDIRTAITGVTPEAKSQIEVALVQLELAVQRGQHELNLLEAKGSFFHSGWRPAVGWTCVFALNWHYMLRDFTLYFLTMLLPAAPPPPRLDVMDLIALLSALLGLGAYRTFEKTRKG